MYIVKKILYYKKFSLKVLCFLHFLFMNPNYSLPVSTLLLLGKFRWIRALRLKKNWMDFIFLWPMWFYDKKFKKKCRNNWISADLWDKPHAIISFIIFYISDVVFMPFLPSWDGIIFYSKEGKRRTLPMCISFLKNEWIVTAEGKVHNFLIFYRHC